MASEDRIKKLEVALRGYANRNLILSMENKRLIEENEGLKKVLKVLEECLLRMDERLLSGASSYVNKK